MIVVDRKPSIFSYCAINRGKSLSGQIKSASLRKQNQVGKTILKFMRDLLDPISIAWEGPHEWQDLVRLCQLYKVQAVIFCQVMGNQPMYFSPVAKNNTIHNGLPFIFVKGPISVKMVLNPTWTSLFLLSLPFLTSLPADFATEYLQGNNIDIIDVPTKNRLKADEKSF